MTWAGRIIDPLGPPQLSATRSILRTFFSFLRYFFTVSRPTISHQLWIGVNHRHTNTHSHTHTRNRKKRCSFIFLFFLLGFFCFGFGRGKLSLGGVTVRGRRLLPGAFSAGSGATVTALAPCQCGCGQWKTPDCAGREREKWHRL